MTNQPDNQQGLKPTEKPGQQQGGGQKPGQQQQDPKQGDKDVAGSGTSGSSDGSGSV